MPRLIAIAQLQASINRLVHQKQIQNNQSPFAWHQILQKQEIKRSQLTYDSQ